MKRLLTHLPASLFFTFLLLSHPTMYPTKQTNNTSIFVEVCIGELIDKITILEIKSQKITDSKKLQNIRTELTVLQETLNATISTSSELEELTNKLRIINNKLWNIEDDIRDKERNQEFDNEFIELARRVYFTNDERCALKRAINNLLGSRLVEEKSYTDYTTNSTPAL